MRSYYLFGLDCGAVVWSAKGVRVNDVQLLFSAAVLCANVGEIRCTVVLHEQLF